MSPDMTTKLRALCASIAERTGPDGHPDVLTLLAAMSAALDGIERLRAELAALDVDQPYHVLDVRENGWTLKHPLSCRPRLFDCPVNAACERLDGPPIEVGRWAVDVDEDGGLLVRHRAEESETT